MDNITFVTINVNNSDNTTLAIQCPAATVYRIADGTEFSRYNMQYEIGNVDMSFKTGISVQSEYISRVYLGDQFYMIMEYIGQSNYTIVPQKCTVYEGNIASGNGVEIWNNTACVLNIGLTVMENFTYTGDGRLYVKMYGFRFNKNGIHDITVKCDLTLCLPGKVKQNQICGKQIGNRSEVTVRIWDKLHDRNQHRPFPKGSVNVIGERGIDLFKLICDDIPDAGVERTAERQMHLKDEEKMTDQRFEVDNVKMTFRTNSEINSEELTTIYTGDGFYMFLKYNGESNYVVMPIKCTALKGYNVDVSRYENAPDGSEKVLLWNNTACLSEILKSQSLMEDFNINDKFAKAKMYGFHFSNSPYVSIICEVTVCKSLKSSGCLKSTNAHRRKRKTTRSNVNTSDYDVLYRNNLPPQMKGKEHQSIERRSIKTEDSKNLNLKVYKSIHVLDTKAGISGTRASNSLSVLLHLTVIALTIILLSKIRKRDKRSCSVIYN